MERKVSPISSIEMALNMMNYDQSNHKEDNKKIDSEVKFKNIFNESLSEYGDPEEITKQYIKNKRNL